MAKSINIVEAVNAIVQAQCAEEGKTFKMLDEAGVIKFAIAGVKHRMHNMQYNKKSREKARMLDKLVESGVLTKEQVAAMMSDE